jgi:hypothetical protein
MYVLTCTTPGWTPQDGPCPAEGWEYVESLGSLAALDPEGLARLLAAVIGLWALVWLFRVARKAI